MARKTTKSNIVPMTDEQERAYKKHKRLRAKIAQLNNTIKDLKDERAPLDKALKKAFGSRTRMSLSNGVVVMKVIVDVQEKLHDAYSYPKYIERRES